MAPKNAFENLNSETLNNEISQLESVSNQTNQLLNLLEGKVNNLTLSNTFYKQNLETLQLYHNNQSILNVSENAHIFDKTPWKVIEPYGLILHATSTIISYTDTKHNVFSQMSMDVQLNETDSDIKVSSTFDGVKAAIEVESSAPKTIILTATIKTSSFESNTFLCTIQPWIGKLIKIDGRSYSNEYITYETKDVNQIVLQLTINAEYFFMNTNGRYMGIINIDNILFANIITPSILMLYSSCKKRKRSDYIVETKLNHMNDLISDSDLLKIVDITTSESILLSDAFEITTIPNRFPITNMDQFFTRILLTNETKQPLLVENVLIKFEV